MFMTGQGSVRHNVVSLYGVEHNFFQVSTHGLDYREGRFSQRQTTQEIERSLSRGLIQSLSWVPSGTKVGVEDFGPEDYAQVKRHFDSLGFPERFSGGYSASLSYWTKLRELLTSLEFEVVSLESKEPYFRYNYALREVAHWSGENDDFHASVVGEFNTKSDKSNGHWGVDVEYALARSKVNSRRIFEIERGRALLEAIKHSGVKVAFVGLGHANHWRANSSSVEEQFGVVFNSYDTETIVPPEGSKAMQVVFSRNLLLDFSLNLERRSLERMVRLVEIGSISGRCPIFSGVFDSDPLTGFFEVFPDPPYGPRNRLNLNSGTIVTCFGDYSFSASYNGPHVKLNVIPKSDISPDGLIKEAVEIRGVRHGNSVFGRFIQPNTGGRGYDFCLTHSLIGNRQGNIIDLSHLLVDFNHGESKKWKRLRKILGKSG